MDVEIVKPEFVPVENGTEDQSKVNGPLSGPTEPIMFGSHGPEEVVNGPLSGPTEDHLPKNVVDHWPATVKVHSVYFVRHRSFDDPKLKPKFDAAEKDVQNKSQARSQIIGKIQVLQSKRAELSKQIKPLHEENERFKSLLDDKKKEMEPVNKALNDLRPSREKGAVPICSSEEELNRAIKSLQYRIQHESIPLTEEKQILREIKQLEGTRAQILAKVLDRASIEKKHGTKADMQDQINLMGDGFSEVKKERQVVTAKLKPLFVEKTALKTDIEKLEKELKDATEKRDKAKEVLKDLWKKHDEGNACFYQYRKISNDAKHIAIKKDLAALNDFSNSELEKFMKTWKESEAFREEYKKRSLPTLGGRQLSRDGRMRGPDEKPLVVREPPTSSKPEQITALKPKQTKNDSVSTVQNSTEKTEKVTKSKPIKEVKSKAVEPIVLDNEDKIIEIEKPKIVEKKVDEAKLKEIRREEEIAKAKQALERKKKLAEKAAAKAAIKAQKEAEKKEKDREKKLKKKAGLVPESEEQPAEAEAEVPEPEETEEAIEKPVVSKSKGRKDIALRNRIRSKGQDVTKPIFKRKKSTNYWVWAAPAAVSIMVVFVIAYKYLI